MFFAYTGAWSYPLQKVTNRAYQKWNSDYMIDLPKITNADYYKFKDNRLYNNTYSMLWATTYFDGRDIGLGTHQWIDVSTNEWTEVYAIWSGKVIFAGDKWSRGKLVIIEHERRGKKLFSSYSHLYEIMVESGAVVTESQLIAKVWKTWNATWPHLHFQIDVNPNVTLPFFPMWCGTGINEIVNWSKCQQQIFENTIDPVLFLERNGDVPLYLEKEAVSTSKVYASLADFTVSLTGSTGWILRVGNSANLVFALKKYGEVLAFDKSITLQYDEKMFDIFPKQFSVIASQKSISIKTLKSGIWTIKIKKWTKVIKTISILVLDDKLNATIKASAGNAKLLASLKKMWIKFQF